MSEPKLTGSPRAPDVEELSERDLELMERLFSNPRLWPDTAKVWIADYVAQNLMVPISQVQGFTQFTASYATVLTTEEVTSTTYTDPTTPGPTITGLADGQYLLIFGFQLGPASNLTSAHMSPSVNGATPSDDDSAQTRAVEGGTARAVVKTVEGTGSNTVKMQYRRVGGTDGDFERRWLVALRIAAA